MIKNQKILIVGEAELNVLVNICISTRRIKKLILPNKKEIRPQLHCIIYGRMGSGKSSILWDISKATGVLPVVNFTSASFYGTVDKNTGMLNPPMIWQSRNNCLLVDEYFFDSHSNSSMSVLTSLLPILEFPYINKRVGFRCNDVDEKDQELYLKVKDGTIECKSRFVLIMDTMMNLKSMHSMWLKALLTRCLVIPHYPTLGDLKKLTKDGTFFEFKKKRVRDVVKISSKNYDIILGYAEKNCTNEETYLRTVGDYCRIFAVLKRHDEAIYIMVSKLRNQF